MLSIAATYVRIKKATSRDAFETNLQFNKAIIRNTWDSCNYTNTFCYTFEEWRERTLESVDMILFVSMENNRIGTYAN